MELSTGVLVMWGTWALLRFWVRERLVPPVTAPFTRLALRTLVDQSLVLTVAAGTALTAMQFVVWSSAVAGVANVSLVRALLAAIGHWTDVISSAADAAGTVLLLLLIVAAGIVWHLHARAESRRRLERALQAEIERLLRERDADPAQWASEPPNEAMEEIDRIIATLHEQWLAARRDSSLSESDRQAELARIQAQASHLLAIREGIDVRRRVQTIDAESERPATWRERFMLGLASRGLIGDARTAASYLGILAATLTMLTMVGFASAPVSTAVLSRVNALELKSSRQAAEASMAEAAPAISDADDSQWNDTDERALQQFTTSIVRVSLESRSFPLPQADAAAPRPAADVPNTPRPPPGEWAEPADAWEHSRRDQIRRAILETPDTPKPPASAAEVETSTVARTIETATDTQRHDATVSRLVAESQGRLRVELQRRPTLLGAFRAHAAEYQRLIHPVDLRAGLVSGLFGQVAGDTGIPQEFQRILMPLAEDTGETVLHEYLRLQEVRALESLARGNSFDSALDLLRYSSNPPLRYGHRSVREIAANLPPDDVRQVLERIQPSARAAGATPSAEAIRTATEITRTIDAEPREAVEALATYDDYFPPRPRGEETTALGRLEQTILASRPPVQTPDVPAGGSGSDIGYTGPAGGGGGGGGGRRSPSVTEARRVSYARSRSFRMARGFARVGGVLIGRPPEGRNSEVIGINAFDSTVSGHSVTLRIGKGPAGTLGPFPASAVDGALRYAADGRVTTVTMTSAAPLLELKILLHPVLEDTPIGADAIELDRFVDTYARSVASVRAEEERIQGQYALYEAAWTLRQIAALEILSKSISEASGSLARARADVERLLPSVRVALRQPASDLLDSKESILAAKPAWFDHELVRRISAAAASGSAEAWRQQLSTAFGLDASNAIASGENGQTTLEAWFEEPAQFQVWSGVRERPWTADASLAFATPAEGDELWPFQFMLQASFVTAPRFGDGQSDDAPFEYEAVARDIQTAVAKGIHSPAGAKAGHPHVVRRMREFAVLQRVFRLALAGQIGPDFPLERLASLAAAVRSHREVQRTPRWNIRPGALEAAFARLLTATQLMASLTNEAELGRRLERCVSTVSLTTSQNAWEQVCDFVEDQSRLRRTCDAGRVGCPLAQRVTALNSLTRARRLRQELGVRGDEVF